MTERLKASCRAYRFLTGMIAQYVSQEKQRLPNVNTLAGMAGVSHVTIIKAVRRLRDEGRLTVSHGRGITVVTRGRHEHAGATAPTHQDSRHPRWRDVYTRLCADIVNGRYAPGSVLPPAKNLAAQYGACYRTLRKALQSLAGKRFIEAYRKSYRVSTLLSGQSRGRIMLIAAGYVSGVPQIHSPRMQDHFRALEAACAQNRIPLDTCAYDSVSDGLYSGGRKIDVGGSVAASKELLGFLFWTQRIDGPAVSRIIATVAGLGRPVAVLDETGGNSIERNAGGRALLRIFSLGNSPACGEHVGRYLLELGHRRIAYLSPTHAAEWSKNREHGLRRAFQAVGTDKGVQSVTVEQDQPALPLDIEDVHGALDAMLESRQRYTGVYHQQDLSQETARMLRTQLTSILYRSAIRPRLSELFERAAACRDITAWVGANDDVALEALSFLQSRKRAVPQDVSVIGFDDIPEACFRRLSSYNFNGMAVVRAMLAYVLEPHLNYPAPEASRRTELQGFVAGRNSTAPVTPLRHASPAL